MWKIYTPVGAYSEEDKQALSEAVTNIYAQVPIPKFYVVTIFEEVPAGSVFVGGVKNPQFVRIKIDQIARTLPGAVVREWWVRNLDKVLAPWLGDRGFDWEISIDETPFDLWSLQGQIPPPFESVGEKRWVEENAASPYTQEEKLPVNLTFGAPLTEGRALSSV